LFYSSFDVDKGEPINKSLDDLAVEKALEIKQILVEGAKKSGGTRAYVNYAYGGEPLEEIYGEKWRLDKLRRLKKEYDPLNRFRFYAPIVPESEEDEGHSEL
jgi:hypothetical protein